MRPGGTCRRRRGRGRSVSGRVSRSRRRSDGGRGRSRSRPRGLRAVRPRRAGRREVDGALGARRLHRRRELAAVAARRSRAGTSRREGASSERVPRPLPGGLRPLRLVAIGRDPAVDLVAMLGVVADGGADVGDVDVAPLRGGGDRLLALEAPSLRVSRPPPRRQDRRRGPPGGRPGRRERRCRDAPPCAAPRRSDVRRAAPWTHSSGDDGSRDESASRRSCGSRMASGTCSRS